jgi:signal transduction histidine kinase
MRGKLRNKLLKAMFAIGFIPIVILGLLSFYSIKIFHNSDLASIENNLINQKAEEIDSFVQSIVSTFQIKVSFEQVSDIEINSQYFLLKQLVSTFPDIQEVSFINTAGRETSRINKDFPDGVPAEELQDQREAEKFLKAGNGENYISPVYVTAIGPTITVSAPVFNRNDVLISVLSGEVSLVNLQNIVERSRLGSTGYLYIVARDGFLIAHSQTDKLGISSLANHSFVKGVINKVPDVADHNRYNSAWNEPVVAAGKYLDNLQMGIIAEWPVSEADKVLHTLNYQSIAFSLIVLAGTVFFSLFMAGRIVKPIKALESGTQKIAEGKFDEPINIRTGDEIEELGVAFNNMTEGLKRLQELKNEFVFIAAHELRTPLAGIKGFLALLRDESGPALGADSMSYITRALGAGDRLAKLVDEILEIARSEAGKIKIDVTPQDITESIRTIMVELKSVADQKRISITYDQVTGLPKVMADPAKLKEVITNFISNAVKYNNDGGWIRISHEINGGEVVTHFEDNGFGISEAEQKHLFEKFFRADIGRMKSIEGTGLGLFITKELIEKMGGRVWFKSLEGKGTTFSFSLKAGNNEIK